MVQMNAIYADMVNYFDAAAENPSLLMEGHSPFAEEFLHRDQWWEDIFQPNRKLESHALIIAGIVMASFAAFTRRKFADHLEGGVHANITAAEVQGVPKHNMHLERGLGYWDNKKRRVPNMSSAGAEACLLFTMNKTLPWLEKLPEEEREALIKCCQKQTPGMQTIFKERSQKIQQELEARLRQKQQEKAEKEARIIRDKLVLQRKVEEAGGLWQSVEQMEAALLIIKDGVIRGEGKKKTLDAIKDQMNYRKTVLQQPASAKDWTFSENRKALNEEQLKAKIARLIGGQSDT